MSRRALVALLAIAGCSYPEISFSGSDSASTDAPIEVALDVESDVPAEAPPTDAGADTTVDVAPDAPSDAQDAAVDAPACPTKGGAMVRIDDWCIDATEVTNEEYAKFLAEADLAAQPKPRCTANVTFVPVSGWPPPLTKAKHPVVYVDWCDAYAFCQWAGKRLCGSPTGGATAFANFAKATSSQWYAACSSKGAFTYPYGTTYDATKCNGDGTAGMLAVGSKPECRGSGAPFDAVLDMSGNAWEWENSSSTFEGASDLTRLRGGAHANSAVNLRCEADRAVRRDHTSSEIGFRCCAGP